MYGALLVLRSQSSGKVEEGAREDTVRTYVHTIECAISGCLGNLDLIDGISTAQEALLCAEGLQREKEFLRREVLSLSDLKGQAEARCSKVMGENAGLQIGEKMLIVG